MMNLTANDKKYKLSDQFSDVKLKELRFFYDWLMNRPINVKRWLEGRENHDLSENDILDFKINVICHFSNFERENLQKVDISGENGLTIDFLFNSVSKFLYFPTEVLNLDKFKFNGTTYYLLSELKTVEESKILFNSGSYNQFKLAAAMATAIDNNKTPNAINSLIGLCAVLYTNGDNSDDAINKRVKEFEELDALTAFSCYFFFALLSDKYVNYFRSYSMAPQKEKAKMEGLIHLERLKKSLSRTTFGKLLLPKSLKKDYLILHKHWG